MGKDTSRGFSPRPDPPLQAALQSPGRQATMLLMVCASQTVSLSPPGEANKRDINFQSSAPKAGLNLWKYNLFKPFYYFSTGEDGRDYEEVTAWVSTIIKKQQRLNHSIAYQCHPSNPRCCEEERRWEGRPGESKLANTMQGYKAFSSEISILQSIFKVIQAVAAQACS